MKRFGLGSMVSQEIIWLLISECETISVDTLHLLFLLMWSQLTAKLFLWDIEFRMTGNTLDNHRHKEGSAFLHSREWGGGHLSLFCHVLSSGPGISWPFCKAQTCREKKIIFSHHLGHCLPNGTYNVMKLPPGGWDMGQFPGV